MKKKVICVTLAAALMFGAMPAYAATDNAVRVVVDNKELTATGVIIDGRTLIPLRALGEALGATVNWDVSKQEIKIEKMLYQSSSKGIVTDSNRIIIMHIGNKEILKNGTAEQLDVAPQVINGSTMVPVKAVTSFLEATTAWDGESKTVKVSSSWNTTPEGAIQGEQNKQIEFGNALGNRIEEINKEAEIEKQRYRDENRPKGDMAAWGYEIDKYITVSKNPENPSYGLTFNIYATGAYKDDATDIDLATFKIIAVNKESGQEEYSMSFKYAELEKWGDYKRLVLPKQYLDDDKYDYKFSVVV